MTEPVNKETKRAGLRFRIKQRAVRYKVNEKEGTALITDLSTGGCAVKEATLALALEDIALFFLDFFGPENTFELEALVVRSQGTEFSVKFLNISEERKLQLLKSIARDLRENK